MTTQENKITLGQKLADKSAKTLGSWTFIITQSLILTLYVLWNTIGPVYLRFDSFPFIFLNLALSFQAAYAAPIIMISNNRQEQVDRDRSISIYQLETSEHEQLYNLTQHIDRHFEKLAESIRKNNLTTCGDNDILP